jgi:hypothetical protein
VLRTLSIITTYANEIIGELHDRMPVILEPPEWPTWLAEVKGDPAALMRPSGEDVLKVWPVSRQVNSPRSNGTEVWPMASKAHVYLRLPILAQVGHDGAQRRLISDLVAAHWSERERYTQPQAV